MRIIPKATFRTVPWKNGGGVTHEIARDTEAEPFGWRLSVAEVGSSGPFSVFPGYMRWLTVIEGDGMRLEWPGGSLAADPMQPVHFAGDLRIDGVLSAGPCRDFNLIYDPLRYTASVTLLKESELQCGADMICGLLLLADGLGAVAGDFIFFDTADENVNLPGVSGLLVSLPRRS